MTDQSRKAITSFFDEMSSRRNELFRVNPILDYEQRVRSRAVLTALAPAAGDRILDIGCGNARDIIPMIDAGAAIVGVDLSPGMIEQARQDIAAAGRQGAELRVGDATHLEFEAGQFDKVLCSEVIEHIPDAAAAVREMRRVLKPGGVLVISTPNRHSWYGFDRYVVSDRLLRKRWNHPFDNWRTMTELTALLQEQGFAVEQRRTVCFLPGFIGTYFLPRPLQSGVAALVSGLERPASTLAPGYGYLLVVTAVAR